MKIAYRICTALLAVTELFMLVNVLTLYCGYEALLGVAHITQGTAINVTGKELLIYLGVFFSALASFILAVCLCRAEQSVHMSVCLLVTNIVFWVLYWHLWISGGWLIHLSLHYGAYAFVHMCCSAALTLVTLCLLAVPKIKARR